MQPARLYLALLEGARPALQFQSAGSGFTFVPRIEDADFVLIPHGVRRFTPQFAKHVDTAIAQAKRHGKKTIIIISGDLGFRLHRADALAFKVSVYAHGKLPGEIAAPPLVEDFWAGPGRAGVPFEPRRKSARPSVGFCGYAGFPSSLTRAKYLLKNAALDAAALALGPRYSARKRGIYFRRKALGVLGRDSRIDARFVIHNAFFLNAAPTPQSREAARREFLDNLRDCDFALAPKGDGNYSIRFFEALSMGRVPILIDTDMVLPLEKIIDYSKFILRVPHTEMHTLPERVVELYNSLSDEQFMDMQRAARNAFVQYLRQDSFYNAAFPLLRDRGPEAL